MATVLPQTIGVVVDADVETQHRDPAFIETIAKKLRDHRVVLFHAQRLSPEAMTGFAAAFGPLLDIRRVGNNAIHVPGHDMIKVLSGNLADDGRPLGDGNTSAQIWHTDSTPWECPPNYISFHCLDAPEDPPHTYFLDMVAVYRDLPEATKERINHLRVIHHQYPRQIEVKIAAEGKSLPLEDRMAGRVHPLVRRHLQTHQPILYLPTRRDSIVVGWGEEESRELLEELWEFACASPHVFSAALRPGDVVIWDNAACVHSRDGWDPSLRRVMWHVSVQGEVPTPMHPVKTTNPIGLSDDARRDLVRQEFGDY